MKNSIYQALSELEKNNGVAALCTVTKSEGSTPRHMGIILLVFTPLTWIKRFWNVKERLQYTFVTLSAWVVLFELIYWNLLKI